MEIQKRRNNTISFRILSNYKKENYFEIDISMIL